MAMTIIDLIEEILFLLFWLAIFSRSGKTAKASSEGIAYLDLDCDKGRDELAELAALPGNPRQYEAQAETGLINLSIFSPGP
jgi:hypothetical protein